MHQLKYSQKVPLTLEECWKFFSDPKNLKILTPSYLSFDLIGDADPAPMYPGQIIAYKIRPVANVPITWVTEITHVNAPYYFVDEQRFGPYSFWHHQHHFKPIPGGVEMTDIIHYQLPLGPVGQFINSLKVKKDIEKIFAFRKEKMIELFGSTP